MNSSPVTIAPKLGPIHEGGTPWRWIARAISADYRDARPNGWAVPRRLLPDLARAFVGRPVRWVQVGDHLGHPPASCDPEDLRHRVGRVTDAWARPWAVLVVIAIDADAGRLQRTLAAMHRIGTLQRSLGLSLHGAGERSWPDPQSEHSVLTEVGQIYALDFVTTPADPSARILRPLHPDENPNPSKETRP